MRINTSIISTLEKIAESNTVDFSTTSAKIAAAVVRRGEIISIGQNSNKSHPFQAKYSENEFNIFFHAETHAIHNAIREYGDDLRGTTIYVVRRKKNGERGSFVNGLAKPCKGCMRAILEYKIKNVVYSLNTNNDFCCEEL